MRKRRDIDRYRIEGKWGRGGIWITIGWRESEEEEGYGSPWDRGKVRKRRDMDHHGIEGN